MANWFLFTSIARAQTADLKIAQNMSAMFPLNPQEHYANIEMLKTGGVEIGGVTYVCGYRALDLERGYTQAQVDGYLADVEWDTVAEYPEGNETDWFDPFE
jgi:hypothetical protein